MSRDPPVGPQVVNTYFIYIKQLGSLSIHKICRSKYLGISAYSLGPPHLDQKSRYFEHKILFFLKHKVNKCLSIARSNLLVKTFLLVPIVTEMPKVLCSSVTLAVSPFTFTNMFFCNTCGKSIHTIYIEYSNVHSQTANLNFHCGYPQYRVGFWPSALAKTLCMQFVTQERQQYVRVKFANYNAHNDGVQYKIYFSSKP